MDKFERNIIHQSTVVDITRTSQIAGGAEGDIASVSTVTPGNHGNVRPWLLGYSPTKRGIYLSAVVSPPHVFRSTKEQPGKECPR